MTLPASEYFRVVMINCKSVLSLAVSDLISMLFTPTIEKEKIFELNSEYYEQFSTVSSEIVT